jgi:hypothetical protein
VTGEQEMAPAIEEEPAEELGWTRTYIYKHAPHTAPSSTTVDKRSLSSILNHAKGL